MSSPPRVSASIARRFQLLATGLIDPHSSVAAALAHHGYVQIDPINVCGRMHDHILRHRVAGYAEGDLFRHLHGSESALPSEDRLAFEHHLPSTHLLVALPLNAWPYLRHAMRRRMRTTGPWLGRLTPREKVLATRILEEIRQRGPLSSDDIDDTRRSRRFWGAATLAKSTMQKLFFHGDLLIALRDKGRRKYALPDRVLPSSVLTRPEPTTAETRRWEILLKLRQRRLVALKRGEPALVADAVTAVHVDDGPPLYALREDLPLFDAAATITPPPEVRPLAPLDPLIYDRALTRRLWMFDYTWEVYTPPSKRVRGYYALPLLAGDRLVGHLDAKADRAAGRLLVLSRQVSRGHATAPAVKELARFLCLKT